VEEAEGGELRMCVCVGGGADGWVSVGWVVVGGLERVVVGLQGRCI